MDDGERLYDLAELEQPIDSCEWELQVVGGDLKVGKKRPPLSIPPHTISIEGEDSWAKGWPGGWPEGWSPTNSNAAAVVTLANGTSWWATFYTYDNIQWLVAKNRQTGENRSGQYLLMNHVVLVDEISRARISEVVAELLQTEELEHLFVRVESATTE